MSFSHPETSLNVDFLKHILDDRFEIFFDVVRPISKILLDMDCKNDLGRTLKKILWCHSNI